jgi:hypothetical protein
MISVIELSSRLIASYEFSTHEDKSDDSLKDTYCYFYPQEFQLYYDHLSLNSGLSLICAP